MNPWPFILVITTLALFTLPLLPAIIELLAKTDIKPLRVVRDHEGNVQHFAESFRRYIHGHFDENAMGNIHSGTMEDGRPYQLVGGDGIPVLGRSTSTQQLIISRFSLRLQNSTLFEGEIYSQSSITTGKHNHLRAVLAEEHLTLQEGSEVLRWAHCEGTLRAEEYCVLHGRASAGQAILLARGAQFERLHAPRIVIGGGAKKSLVADSSYTVMDEPERILHRLNRRFVVQGKCTIPAWHTLEGDVIAQGEVTLARHVLMRGSVKSNGAFIAEEGVRITGSAVSSEDMTIGAGCEVEGPVIAQGILRIGTGAVIGSMSKPVSVSAEIIYVEEGVTIYGTLMALRHGEVIPPNALYGRAVQRAV